MRTADSPDGRLASDLTARARVRDAAIDCFTETGFDASFRTIARRAGVSPGLITHHFGSKEALRAECDAEVLRRYRAIADSADDDVSLSMFRWLADPDDSSGVAIYLVRAVHAGGEPARVFLDHLIDEARTTIGQMVDRGLIRPSRNEEARLRYLARQSLGVLLVELALHPDLTAHDLATTMHAGLLDSMLPMLELYTEGLMTDSQLLEDYLQYLWKPPGSPPDDAAGVPVHASPASADRPVTA